MLKAEPDWISGLGNHVLALNANVLRTVNLVNSHSGSTGEFKGLMDNLKDPIDTLCRATVRRQSTLGPAMQGTSVNLKQAAWNYTSTDHEAALGIAHTRTQEYNTNPFIPPAEVMLGTADDPVIRIPVVDDVPHARLLAAPREIDVVPPPNENVDWNALIEESAGWLADADSFIEDLSGWSPIREALEPVAGNWMELKRIGKTYGKSGGAFDTVAGDLTSGHGEIDEHWNGQAAVAYSAYSTEMVKGLNWEGSVGRLVEQGLSLSADQLESAAKAIIELVQKGLSRIVKVDSFTGALKLAAKVVPGAGTAAAIAEVSHLLLEVSFAVEDLIRELKSSIDAVSTFIEFCNDPIGFAHGRAEDKVKEELKPFTDFLEKAQSTRQLVIDVDTALDLERLSDRPTAAYNPGSGPEIWEDEP
ncbi:WXG100 family type VII secretion target [Gordonia sp. SL306]|uniref:WXG100 family type VII secretion target n=1 Tax=Gordonia sp. SL306 TaxID=2995145 RepID=UPI002270AEEA|nr:hypothetical protein [Gordonia sp. SL306]WAC57576.1 hypothetical protein OVA31_10250 [Gordonia sp. SL306]